MSEKLTISPPVTVRFSESLLEKLNGLAKIRDMDRSELIRHLVEAAVEVERRKWVELNAVFSTSDISATNTAHTLTTKVVHRDGDQS